MTKTTYKLKEKYINTSICPGVKVIKLSELSQEQILSIVDMGYDEFFTEVKPKKKDK